MLAYLNQINGGETQRCSGHYLVLGEHQLEFTHVQQLSAVGV